MGEQQDAEHRAERRQQRRLADELRTVLQRYEIALRGSHMTLFTQDRDLRFTSISNPLFGREVVDIVGRTDTEILPAESVAQFGTLARAALATGKAQGGEVSVKHGDTRWYELHVEPLLDSAGAVIGVACALFDVIRMKTLYGKQVRGVERSTFVADRRGVLRREWRGVKVPGHAQEVLDFVKTL